MGYGVCDPLRGMEPEHPDEYEPFTTPLRTKESPSEVKDPEEPPASSTGRRDLMLTLLALGGSAALMFGLLVLRTVPSSAAPNPRVPPTHAPAAPAATTAHPSWSAQNRAHYVGANRKGVAFELPSDNRISVWTRTVQPSLVVRCIAGTVDAFVVTESAAKLEPETDDHTVTFGFDDGADTTERWPDSSEHDALFAPDGSQFTMRIAAARTMRFAFTPHNAAPAVATFRVDGLASLLESSAKECGMKGTISASRRP
jgi:hypothetical protein